MVVAVVVVFAVVVVGVSSGGEEWKVKCEGIVGVTSDAPGWQWY